MRILLDSKILVSDVPEPDFAAFADIERNRAVPIHLVRRHACLASPVVHEGAQDIGVEQQFDLVPPLLADALRRLIAAKIPLDGASDHGVSEALYLRDPDENGVELYWDRPKESWPRDKDGGIAMFTRHLDLGALLKEAPEK